MGPGDASLGLPVPLRDREDCVHLGRTLLLNRNDGFRLKMIMISKMRNLSPFHSYRGIGSLHSEDPQQRLSINIEFRDVNQHCPLMESFDKVRERHQSNRVLSYHWWITLLKFSKVVRIQSILKMSWPPSNADFTILPSSPNNYQIFKSIESNQITEWSNLSLRCICPVPMQIYQFHQVPHFQ